MLMNLSFNNIYSQINPLKSPIIDRILTLFNYQNFHFESLYSNFPMIPVTNYNKFLFPPDLFNNPNFLISRIQSIKDFKPLKLDQECLECK